MARTGGEAARPVLGFFDPLVIEQPPLVTRVAFEPTTLGLRVQRSAGLSYRATTCGPVLPPLVG